MYPDNIVCYVTSNGNFLKTGPSTVESTYIVPSSIYDEWRLIFEDYAMRSCLLEINENGLIFRYTNNLPVNRIAKMGYIESTEMFDYHSIGHLNNLHPNVQIRVFKIAEYSGIQTRVGHEYIPGHIGMNIEYTQ
jgi:hypothetical protein